jgi:hypothetical protein
MIPLLIALLALAGAALLYLSTRHQPWPTSARTSVVARLSGLLALGVSWLSAAHLWPLLTATCYVMVITMAGLTVVPFAGALAGVWLQARRSAAAP